MKAEVMTVTPELAKEFLKGNTLNRSVSNSRVTLYAKDMKDSKWTLTGNGISISKDGRLLDGQHRLLAVVKADVPVQMLVCTEIDNGVAEFDTGRKRSLADMYKLNLGRNDSILTTSQGCAFVRSCYDTDWLANAKFAVKNVANPSFAEINDYVTKNYENIEKHYSTILKGGNGASKGLCKVQTYSIARAAVNSTKNSFTFADYVHFCTVLKTGCVIEDFDAPFIGLRDKLMLLSGGGRSVNAEIRLRVCYAIKQYLNKSTSRVNKLVEYDKFSLADFI